MNLLVRPVLNVIAIPLHILASLLTLILVNGIFIAITMWIADQLEAELVVMDIIGFSGWIVVPIVLGAANWVMKVVLVHGQNEG
jgi:uncharacterized membrane protein YvlD (DUF360 family)